MLLCRALSRSSGHWPSLLLGRGPLAGPLTLNIHDKRLKNGFTPRRDRSSTVFAASAAGAGAAAGDMAGNSNPTPAPASSPPPAPRSRMWPDEPRVGVGVVVFRGRAAARHAGAREILLVRRAKPPALGLWCVPGGSLELGETLAECAAREVAEETGVAIEFDRGAAAAGDRRLRAPTPFAAVDSIEYARGYSGSSGGGGGGGGGRDGANPPQQQQQQQQQQQGKGRVRFHYVVVEVAAVAAAEGGGGEGGLRPGDDVSDARWARLDELEALGDTLVPNCARLAWEAAERFDLSPL